MTLDDSIKRWTAKQKTELVIEIIQGMMTVAKASCSFDPSPSEIAGWIEDAKRGMENSLRANPLDIRKQHEEQLMDLQEAYGEAMLEPRARKKVSGPHGEAVGRHRSEATAERRSGIDPDAAWGPACGGDLSAAGQAVRLVRRAAQDDLLHANQGYTEGRSPACRPYQGVDRGRTVLWLSHGCQALGLQEKHGSMDLPVQGLAGLQTTY